jgi:hypothetical protein
MSDPEDLRREFNTLVTRLEEIIAQNRCEDIEIQRALLEVAQNHMWRAGLWARVRWAANVIGALGIVGGGLVVVGQTLGFEVLRK